MLIHFLGQMCFFYVQSDNHLSFFLSVGGNKRFGWRGHQRKNLSDLPNRQFFQPLAAQWIYPETGSIAGLCGTAIHHDGVLLQGHTPPQLQGDFQPLLLPGRLQWGHSHLPTLDGEPIHKGNSNSPLVYRITVELGTIISVFGDFLCRLMNFLTKSYQELEIYF